MNYPCESPTTVEGPLEYITVDSYEWPKDPLRPRRPRLETEEQKQRHRADQKRFVERKRTRLAILRNEATLAEKQFHYLKAVQEEAELRAERQRLDALEQIQCGTNVEESPLCWSVDPVALDAPEPEELPTELESLLTEVLFSL